MYALINEDALKAGILHNCWLTGGLLWNQGVQLLVPILLNTVVS